MSADGEWEPAEKIDDPDELSQTHRIRELLQRRAHALDVGEEAARAMLSGDLERDEARMVFLQAIRSLILDLYTKLDGVTDEEGRSYLSNHPIGTLTVDVPGSLPQNARDERLAPGASPPQPREFGVEGLQWFVEHDFPFQVAFRVRTMHGQPGVDTETVDVFPPMQLLYQALVACEEAMDDLGIDAEIGIEEGDAKFDYSDILEEGAGGDFPDIEEEDGAE